MANTKIPAELSSTPSIVDAGNATAISIDSSENVGIGTTNPSSGGALLNLETSSSSVVNYNSTNSNGGYIKFQRSGTTKGYVGTPAGFLGGGDADDLGIRAQADFTVATGGANERMRIDSSGNVAIGTNSPSAATPLTVYYSNTSAFNIGGPQGGISNNVYYSGSAYVNRNTSAGGTLLQMGTDGSFAFRRATSGSSPTLSYSMYIDASGNVGVGTVSPFGTTSNRTVLSVNGTSSATINIGTGGGQKAFLFTEGSYVRLSTLSSLPLTFGINDVERMRINSSGGLCVGTTSGPSAGNIIVSEGIYIGANNGDNQIRSSSAGGGSATLYIGNAAIQVSSDKRLKTNIVDTSISALDKINEVRVVDFEWNDPTDTSYNNRNARGLWTGVIAQEIVDVFPFAVNAPRNEEDLSIDNDSENTWQLEHGALVPVLVKAIQELQARIEALEKS